MEITFRREICIWWRGPEILLLTDVEADSFNLVCCNTSTTAAFWFFFIRNCALFDAPDLP